MLEDFLCTQDIALLQEVTCPHLDSVRRYTQHINVGIEKRGTAILAKDGIMLTDIKCLPSGRGINARYNRISLIDVYVPSGSERKQERKYFYNTDHTYYPAIIQTSFLQETSTACYLTQMQRVRGTIGVPLTN
jgi:exonuclease III